MQAIDHRYTIVIVTHNMQQKARVADRTAFFGLDQIDRVGRLIEYGATTSIFRGTKDSRTRDYVSGRLG